MNRGSGKTTRAMLAAPKNAVFIWVSTDLSYPRSLAESLGRSDLKIVSPAWLTNYAWAGNNYSGIVLDSDTRLNEEQKECFEKAKPRIKS